jgi:hypothetical protein
MENVQAVLDASADFQQLMKDTIAGLHRRHGPSRDYVPPGSNSPQREAA